MCGEYKYYHNYREHHMDVLNRYDIITIAHQYSAVYGRRTAETKCCIIMMTQYQHVGNTLAKDFTI